MSNWKAPQSCQSSGEETVSLWRQKEQSKFSLIKSCHKYLTAVFLGTLKRTSKEHFDTETAKLPSEADTNCNLLMKWKCFTRRGMTKGNYSF